MPRDRSSASTSKPVSPRARRALGRLGLDAAQVQGSGPHGRIIEADVLRVVAGKSRSSEMTSMRRSIARITSASASGVPQFHLRAELDAMALLAARAQWLEQVRAENGARLSLTDLILRAMALALRDHPAANVIWRENRLQSLDEIHLGLVVGLDDGLLIPTLRHVDRLTVSQLARQRAEVVAAARHGRLSGSSEGVATSLSNLGTTRVDDFTAVIFPPQSTILTLGRIVERPFVVDGQLRVRPTLRLTLTVDHRVLDGGPAAQWLGRIVRYLEQPALMLSNPS